jgi:hypothetical protein
MGMLRAGRRLPRWARWVVVILAVWDVVWKGLALWQAAKRRQPVWFVALLVLNTVGILPITYLVLMRRRDAEAAQAAAGPWSAQESPASADV